jgi:hypothetical protein
MYGKAARRSKFAQRSRRCSSTPRKERRGSAFCDIHKNLWITMWIVDELRRFAQSGDAQRRSRSKNEQRFAVEN